MRMGNLLSTNPVVSPVSATRSAFRMAHPTVVPTNYDPEEPTQAGSNGIRGDDDS